ncbi:uncharacterized protein C14orf119 homolog [Oncorhynchus keta]|uniref:uncharacterized protein C14orf119 homolog n=1 Tax=Oncorhynchus keta TaxID=8018 RepID=UPI00227B3D99|nr:uncharacterized protein C14orf119 homolog [Oncorhynchus keta]
MTISSITHTSNWTKAYSVGWGDLLRATSLVVRVWKHKDLIFHIGQKQKMSWFFHVNQGSNQQPPVMMPPAAGALSSNAHYPTISSNTLDTANTAGQGWLCTQSSSSSPSLADFPSVPQGLVPPSLENLSCTSLKSAAGREPLPLSYVTLQEQRCVLSWFLSWSTAQRERFLQDLLGKAVPGKVCTLLESLNTLQVKDSPPNIFECQLRLWTQWFESWNEEERNSFLHILEEREPIFVAHFYRGVAGTAGRD